MQNLKNSPYMTKAPSVAHSDTNSKNTPKKSSSKTAIKSNIKTSPKKSEHRMSSPKALPIFSVVGSALKPAASPNCGTPRLDKEAKTERSNIDGGLPVIQEISSQKIIISSVEEEASIQNESAKNDIIQPELVVEIQKVEEVQQPDNQQVQQQDQPVNYIALGVSRPETAPTLRNMDIENCETAPSNAMIESVLNHPPEMTPDQENSDAVDLIAQQDAQFASQEPEFKEEVDEEYKPNFANTWRVDPEEERMEKTLYKKGYLSLKTQGLFVGYQRNYFEVEPCKIYFNQCKEVVEARKDIRCVNLKLTPCEIIDHAEQEFSISTQDQSFNIRLKGDSQEETNEWIDLFTRLFSYTNEKFPLKYQYTQTPDHIYKSDYLVEEELLKRIDTGDILLFKSKHLGAKLQRLFTASDYDHCALCVRVEDEIYLYDSVVGDGVQLTSWNEFKEKQVHLNCKVYRHSKMESKLIFYRISYRKLYVPTPRLVRRIREKIFKFVMHNVGKKYELSVWKLFKRASFYNGGDSDEEEEVSESSNETVNATNADQSLMDNVMNPKGDKPRSNKLMTEMDYRNNDEGFFCSELLAATYKFTGLIDPGVSSSRYLPVSFSQKKELVMRKGTSLSQEFILALIVAPLNIE